MSYILDALRKSEIERQAVTGQNVSVAYPVQFRRNYKPWLIPSLLILAFLMSFALVWWMWSLYHAAQSQPMSTEILPEYIVKSIDLTHDKSPKKIHSPSRNSSIQVEHQKMQANAEITHETKTASNAAVIGDPLKDLPPLDIAGYVHEEKNGSIAMINNRLIHEGEEISPGLKLVKILDDTAIFSYKGYVFSR